MIGVSLPEGMRDVVALRSDDAVAVHSLMARFEAQRAKLLQSGPVCARLFPPNFGSPYVRKDDIRMKKHAAGRGLSLKGK